MKLNRLLLLFRNISALLCLSTLYVNLIRAVRSCRGRDEVDPMVTEFLMQEKTNEVIRASLEKIFASSGFDFPGMKLDWDAIRDLLFSEFSDNSVDDLSFFKRRCDAINIALLKIKEFESNYSDFQLNENEFSSIETTKNILIYERNLASSFFVLYESLRKSNSSTESLKSYVDWYHLLRHYNIEKFPEKKFPIEYLPSVVNRIRSFSSSETVDTIFQEYSSKIDSSLLDVALHKIKRYTEDLSDFCDVIEKKITENLSEKNNRQILNAIEDVESEDIQKSINSLENLFESWSHRFDEEEIYQSALFSKEAFSS